MSSPTLSSSTVTVFSARIESDSGDRTYDRESTKHEFRLHTDTFNAMSTTSLQNSYTSATSCKCSFLLLPLPHQPVAMLNNQRTFLLIIVFSQQQQESHVKRHHCWSIALFLQLQQQNLKDIVASREGKWEMERKTWNMAEVHERASVCDLLSCSSLKGTVKYLKLSEDQWEPVNATMPWARH